MVISVRQPPLHWTSPRTTIGGEGITSLLQVSPSSSSSPPILPTNSAAAAAAAAIQPSSSLASFPVTTTTTTESTFSSCVAGDTTDYSYMVTTDNSGSEATIDTTATAAAANTVQVMLGTKRGELHSMILALVAAKTMEQQTNLTVISIEPQNNHIHQKNENKNEKEIYDDRDNQKEQTRRLSSSSALSLSLLQPNSLISSSSCTSQSWLFSTSYDGTLQWWRSRTDDDDNNDLYTKTHGLRPSDVSQLERVTPPYHFGGLRATAIACWSVHKNNITITVPNSNDNNHSKHSATVHVLVGTSCGRLLLFTCW